MDYNKMIMDRLKDGADDITEMAADDNYDGIELIILMIMIGIAQQQHQGFDSDIIRKDPNDPIFEITWSVGTSNGIVILNADNFNMSSDCNDPIADYNRAMGVV